MHSHNLRIVAALTVCVTCSIAAAQQEPGKAGHKGLNGYESEGTGGPGRLPGRRVL